MLKILSDFNKILSDLLTFVIFVKIHNEPRKKSAVLFDFNYCVLLIIVQGYSSLDLA